MDLDLDKLVIAVFFILPGYVGIHVYEWWLGTRKRETLDELLLSLAASLTGAAVLVALPKTRPVMSYLWDPQLSERTLVGLGLQMAVTVGLAFLSALVASKVLKGRLGGRSLYGYVWDGLWSAHAAEQRYVGVQTSHGYFFGVLDTADTAGAGAGIVLRSPKIWSDTTRLYYESKAELSYIPGEQVVRVDLSAEAQGGDRGRQGESDSARPKAGTGNENPSQ